MRHVTNKMPNISGIDYSIGRLRATNIPKQSLPAKFGDRFRVGWQVGFVLAHIPHTTWVIWWWTN